MHQREACLTQWENETKAMRQREYLTQRESEAKASATPGYLCDKEQN